MSESLVVILPSLAVLILSLSFHEAAHAWMADKLGDPTARLLGRLTLNPLSHIDWIGTVLFPVLAMLSGLPLIGWAKPVPVSWANLRHPRRDFAVVAIAGPISNLILAVAAAAVLLPIVEVGMGPAGELGLPARILFQTVTMNVLLAVFNMIPIPPLDGGNVLAGLVPENIARVIDAIRPWGFIILYVLMFQGILGTIMSPIYLALVRWLL